LLGKLFRVAFERRTTFDASRASALPWLYRISANLLLKHRRPRSRGPPLALRPVDRHGAADRAALTARRERT
jgi:DNA-directed RNA polymerase specialized sigma24 family protein